jgi:hypothetical protein
MRKAEPYDELGLGQKLPSSLKLVTRSIANARGTNDKVWRCFPWKNPNREHDIGNECSQRVLPAYGGR